MYSVHIWDMFALKVDENFHQLTKYCILKINWSQLLRRMHWASKEIIFRSKYFSSSNSINGKNMDHQSIPTDKWLFEAEGSWKHLFEIKFIKFDSYPTIRILHAQYFPRTSLFDNSIGVSALFHLSWENAQRSATSPWPGYLQNYCCNFEFVVKHLNAFVYTGLNAQKL